MKAKSILVLNSGSSSLKYALYNLGLQTSLSVQGLVEQIGSTKSTVTHKVFNDEKETTSETSHIPDHKSALRRVISLLKGGSQSDNLSITAVGHRVVHGGESVSKPSIVTQEIKKAIEHAIPLAPLHNPPNLEGINVAEELFSCPQVAVFDTSFHSTMPRKAFLYALPYDLYSDLKVRRYGFHGTSYLYLTRETARILNKPVKELNAIVMHLGAGASMAAIQGGESVDTTMGCTPLEGLVMATRCGDVDPAVGTILSSLRGLSVPEIDTLLNKKSGMLGLTGEKDMRTIVERAGEDDRCQAALEVYVHRIRKYIGAYLVEMEGQAHALVFSAGVGERSAPIRQMVCEKLEAFGIVLDDVKNERGDREVQADGSRVKILVVPTDEELCIAQQTLEVVGELERERMAAGA